MKILEVIFSLSSGGAERVVVDLCNEFAGMGHEVTLLTVRNIERSSLLSFQKQFLSAKVKLINLKAKYPTPGAVLHIAKLLKTLAPDIVHMHLNVLPYFFPSILFGSKKIKYIHTLHSVAQAACGYRGQHSVNRWFYKTGKIIPVTITELCNQSFQEFYHLPAAIMIENGRSCPQTTAQEPIVREEIQKMKRHPDDKVFIQVGSIGKVKNQLLSLDVFRSLFQKDRHAILLLLGKDRPDQPEYCSLVREGLPPNCFLLGERTNVADYLVNADYFLMPSSYEGLPISLLEAMACGCTPICTAVGGIPNVVTDGQNGYLVPRPDKALLLECIEKRLSADDAFRREAETQFFKTRYDSPVFAEKYLNLFQQNLQA